MSKIEHGSDKHLMLLAAQHNLNMLTGKDMADLLAFGRSCMEAARTERQPLTMPCICADPPTGGCGVPCEKTE